MDYDSSLAEEQETRKKAGLDVQLRQHPFGRFCAIPNCSRIVSDLH